MTTMTTMTTITCEHCASEIDVAEDPGCIQHGGMYVVCKSCRDQAYDRWKKTVLDADWPADITEKLREAFRERSGPPTLEQQQAEAKYLKRGWRA